MTRPGLPAWHLFALLATAACGGTLDAGSNDPSGPLPVDERNPVIVVNDSPSDNWFGEYAFLLTNHGGPRIAGLVVCASNYWPDATANADGWAKLSSAARDSGLAGIPDITPTYGAPLVVPADRNIESTVANRAAGASLIVDLSRQLGSPVRPVVVLVGTALTEVADAYLMDPAVADRIVVVAALGSLDGAGARMTGPNGDLDPWADWIVAHRFRYVQLSAYYDQMGDVAAADLASLPDNALGRWMAAKRPGLYTIPQASDQITVLSASVPGFAVTVQRASPDPDAVFGVPRGQGPPLIPDVDGRVQIVSAVAAPLARARLWEMLVATPSAP